MNMNYDLMTWIEYFVGAFACCFGGFFVGKILLNRNIRNIKFYHYGLLIIFSIFVIINSLTFDNIAKIIGTLFILFLIFKLIFSENSVTSFIFSIVTYIMFVLGEVTVTLLISILLLIFDFNIIDTVVKTFIGNLSVVFFSCLYSHLSKKPINKYMNKLDKTKIISIFLLGIITIFVTISSMYNLYLNNWVINYTFVLNTIIIFGCLILIIGLLKQYLKNKDITDKYILLEDYMKTSAGLVEKYSSTVHKYKNNLIAIKGYLKSDIKEANNYIDNLLENYKTRKYSWFSKINYIKIDTLRYLVYCKLAKAESLSLKISIDVSPDLKKFDSKKLAKNDINILLEILGEYFDNAIYASNESKEKEINFMLYLENDKLIFILANTYKGKVDLSLITKNGYTTKGKDHGLGLYDIDKTLKSISYFKVKYELLDNYFVASLTIDI